MDANETGRDLRVEGIDARAFEILHHQHFAARQRRFHAYGMRKPGFVGKSFPHAGALVALAHMKFISSRT